MKRFMRQSSSECESESIQEICESSASHKYSNVNKKFNIFAEEPDLRSASKRPYTEYHDGSSVNIHNLPAELIEYIFSFLNLKERIRIEKVCKRWQLMSKRVLWKSPGRLGIKLRNDSIFRCALTAILSRCGDHLRQLELNTSQDTWPGFALLRFAFNSIAEFCPHLQEITFVGIHLSDHNLKTMGEGCRRLKVLRMKELCNYTDEGLSALLEICDELEYLEIYRMVSAKCFHNVSRNIKSLQFKCCDYKMALTNITSRCDALEELSLGYAFGLLDVDVFRMFFDKYKYTLKVLCLGPVRYVDWHDCLQNLRSLKVICLRMRWNSNLCNTVFQKYANLTDIYLSSWNITDGGLMSLKVLPALKGIDVCCCIHLNGSGIKALALRGLLEEVYAMNTSIPEECFLKVAQLCPNMRILNVSYNKNISNRLVEAFQENKIRGILKHTVLLFVCATSVTEEFKLCTEVEVKFDVPKTFFGFLPFNLVTIVPHSLQDCSFLY